MSTSYRSYAMIASIGVLGATFAAQAAIVVVSTNLAIPTTRTGLYMNIWTGVTSTSASSAPGWDINIGGTTSLNFLSPGGYNFVRMNAAPATGGPSDLSWGFVISNSMPTASWITGGAATGLALNSSDNYIGFKFVGDDNATHFGWMQLAIGASATGADRRIVSYAYNAESSTSPGGMTMVVPGPGALALLCQAGFMAKRRRR